MVEKKWKTTNAKSPKPSEKNNKNLGKSSPKNVETKVKDAKKETKNQSAPKTSEKKTTTVVRDKQKLIHMWAIIALLLIFVIWLLMWKKETNTIDETVNSNETNTVVTFPDTNTDTTPTTPTANLSCPDAVQAYLDMQASAPIGTAAVAVWDTVEVHYVWRLANGDVFDTSVESIAQSCGSYNAERNYQEWLQFAAGWWQMIKWFDDWVIGMIEWSTKTINIVASEAYWEKTDEAIQDVPFEQLPPKEDWSAYVAWDEIMSMYGPLQVIEVTETWVKIDFNHPLAWQDLIFDITIKSITKN